MRVRRTSLLVTAAAGVALAVAAGPATATAAASANHTVGVVRGAHLTANTTQSNNWSGYNKGLLETGSGFHSISGQWVVPTATRAAAGQAEASSSWIGIGGGCLDASCVPADSTLIQTGTEQDVAADGSATYSTWYELIPAPSISTPLAVAPGDTVSAAITETLPGVWSISLKNLTSGQSWSTTLPYTSTYATAEWIEETPITVGGSGAGLAAMPRLGSVTFSGASVNGAAASLNPAEEMQLVDGNGRVLATPSAPDTTGTAFNDCTYATSCPAP